MGKLTFLALAAIGVAILYSFLSCESPKVPTMDLDEWWGPNELRGKTDDKVRPFQIKFDEKVVKDLKSRLKDHRSFTPPLEGIGFQYGFNSKTLDTWIQYWAEKYNFSEREKFLNQFPQFKTNIQGLDIHFIRVTPHAGIQVVPILIMHGWPGSVREFYELIPLLTKQRAGYDFVFEVIVPSLPGYGFSDGAVRPGLSDPQVAVILHNLMHRLGLNKYYVQGGDWSSVIAASLSTLFPDEILGHHTNFPVVQTNWNYLKLFLGSFAPSLVVDSDLADRMYPLSNFLCYLLEEYGYLHIQATKPDTIGTALNDSPSGLLAYILEKFSTWTRLEHRSKVDGNLEFRFSKDQLIDNVMLYWIPNAITTSMRVYAEHFSDKNRALKMMEIQTPVPTWGIQAKNELFYQPPSFIRTKYTNLINVTVLDDGGHFLAFELPKVFADDVFKAVRAFREHAKGNKIEL